MKEISFFGLHLIPSFRSENDGTALPGSSPTPAGLTDPGTDTRVGGGSGTYSQGEEADGTKSSSVLCRPLGVLPPWPALQPSRAQQLEA